MRRRWRHVELCDRTTDRLGDVEMMSVVNMPFYKAPRREGEPHGSEARGGQIVAQGGVQEARAAVGATHAPPVDGALRIPTPAIPAPSSPCVPAPRGVVSVCQSLGLGASHGGSPW